MPTRSHRRQRPGYNYVSCTDELGIDKQRVILIIDDDEDSLFLMHQTLQGRGFRVLTARSGAEAFKTLDLCHVDLIIADVVMPGINGVDLLREVRSWGTGDKFIVVTAYRDEVSRSEVMGLEPVEYLFKPFDQELLLRIVDRTLQQTPLAIS